MLKSNLSLDARNIRSLLTECVKTHFNVDSEFINSFWMRAALYNSLPQNENIDIILQETSGLISQSEILQNELVIFEDSMVCTNFTSVLRNVV